MMGMVLFSCASKKKSTPVVVEDSSKDALDWSGTYLFLDEEYNLPQMQIVLDQNNTFNLIVGATGDENRNTYVQNGKFEWSENGRAILLDHEIPNFSTNKLVVGENQLIILQNKDAKHLDGLPRFTKVETNDLLTEKYWKLVSINDRVVTNDDFMAKEPHIKFRTEFNHVSGSDGCNGFFGNYMINGNKLTFDKVMSTLMACPDSFVYNHFMKTLREEVTFEVTEDVLILSSGKDVLTFEVVYF